LYYLKQQNTKEKHKCQQTKIRPKERRRLRNRNKCSFVYISREEVIHDF